MRQRTLAFEASRMSRRCGVALHGISVAASVRESRRCVGSLRRLEARARNGDLGDEPIAEVRGEKTCCEAPVDVAQAATYDGVNGFAVHG